MASSQMPHSISKPLIGMPSWVFSPLKSCVNWYKCVRTLRRLIQQKHYRFCNWSENSSWSGQCWQFMVALGNIFENNLSSFDGCFFCSCIIWILLGNGTRNVINFSFYFYSIFSSVHMVFKCFKCFKHIVMWHQHTACTSNVLWPTTTKVGGINPNWCIPAFAMLGTNSSHNQHHTVLVKYICACMHASP
jgi:hypothetical protein